MGFLRAALIGAAVYAGIKHITKKDLATGRSILDAFLDRAPGLVSETKEVFSEVKVRVNRAKQDLVS
ncbi:YtxH domain-containing protein [Pedobacter aquatilis]|uniref:YtxH domain-containing protein n=1 Tax=Pedobacter aquatilis TaxID=351343 RepID=UPI002931880A|nr:YtxH domain-containing protein [Pedobacter aquatilis]